MSADYDVLIVGAGQAGAQAAVALRQKGFEGSIALVGAEPFAPYARPPLSKEYLAGTASFEKLLLRPGAYWEDKKVMLHTGQRVDVVSVAERSVQLSNGASYGFTQLIWAAGGDARRLGCAGSDQSGVHVVRARADVDRLLEDLSSAKHAVVIGGGYIGLETAAALVKMGKQVTILEAQPRLLARVAGGVIGGFFEAEHKRRGADVRLGVVIDRIEGEAGQVRGVRLATGELIPADVVVVGVGISPNVGPLLSAGAAGDNGVLVDQHCRTSLPGIFAIGDCAQHANRFAGGQWVRLESVQNANDMAMTVAKAITGAPEPYEALPWFWSNQYEIRLQTAGLCTGYEKEVVRGDSASSSFSVAYLKGKKLLAMDCVNAPKDFIQAKNLIARGDDVDVDALADTSKPLVPKSN